MTKQTQRRIDFIKKENKKIHFCLNENLEYPTYICKKCGKIVKNYDFAELSKDGNFYWNGVEKDQDSLGWFCLGVCCMKKVIKIDGKFEKEQYTQNYCEDCGCFIEQDKNKCNKCYLKKDGGCSL